MICSTEQGPGAAALGDVCVGPPLQAEADVRSVDVPGVRARYVPSPPSFEIAVAFTTSGLSEIGAFATGVPLASVSDESWNTSLTLTRAWVTSVVDSDAAQPPTWSNPLIP